MLYQKTEEHQKNMTYSDAIRKIYVLLVQKVKKALFLILFVSISYGILGQTNIVIDPAIKYQAVEGWGGSLSWWANIAGGYTDDQIDSLCTWITSPEGLNMNVFVYNIAGGENPDCPYGAHHMRADASIEGYKPTEAGGYDWTRDARQRKILLKIKQKRPDCIFSACSYSPPYWMTYSGCTSGNTDGGNNLKTNYYDTFANYLTEVVKYYHDSLGVTFRTIDPMNEPTNAWTAGGSQEGCGFTKSSDQSNLIHAVYNKLSSKDMLGYCTIAATDGSYVDHTLVSINAFINDGRITEITQINTHTYGGSQHAQLKFVADQHGKRLWQSESGPINVPQTGWDNNMTMAKRIIYDMNVLRPVAWLDWQLLDQGNIWGLIQYNSTPSVWKSKNYYGRMHFSRFIKPGYTIIYNNNANTLAAMKPDGSELVVVICNASSSGINHTLDLNLFGATGNSAAVYKTTGGMEGVHWLGSAYNVYTYQVITGLTNGAYTAKAWVRSNGGQTESFFEAKDFGATPSLKADITTNPSTWTQVTISDIEVTYGQCTIGFKSTAAGGSWITFDNVEFYRNVTPEQNLIVNHDFEYDPATQTPYGWSTSGSNPVADYTQTGGVSPGENCSAIADIAITDNKLSFTAAKRSIYTLVVPVTLAESNPLADGTYAIRAKHSNKYMSVTESSTSDGAIIEQSSWLEQDNLIFNIAYTSKGYKITPLYVDKPVNVSGFSVANGAAVITYSDGGGANQRFSIIDADSGFYKIVVRHSAKCLSVNNAGMNDGDDVVQWEWINADNFKWGFTHITPVREFTDDLNITIFPNPASGTITVFFKDVNDVSIQIFDLKGRKVYESKPVKQQPVTINIENLCKGLYFIRVTGAEAVKTEKLLIE